MKNRTKEALAKARDKASKFSESPGGKIAITSAIGAAVAAATAALISIFTNRRSKDEEPEPGGGEEEEE